MKTIALANAVSKGLIGKKDRILCFRDDQHGMLSWLSRQRFRAEGLTEMQAAGERGRRLYDVALLSVHAHAETENETLEQAVHGAFQHLRPAGRMIVFRESDDLFAALGGGGDFQNDLSRWLTQDHVASIAKQPDADAGVETWLVRKGGAYKPRFQVKHIAEETGLGEACAFLMHEPCIGLDVETSLREPRILCTVQLANENTVFLVDALPLKNLQPLKMLMECPSVLKIIHNKAFEEKVLGAYGIRIHNVYDTLIESRKRYKTLRNGGHKLGEVCERELGIYLDKSYQASDWTRRPLSQEQLDYAASDAEVLIRLYRLFVPPPPPRNLELF